jgi:hypothetical protein
LSLKVVGSKSLAGHTSVLFKSVHQWRDAGYAFRGLQYADLKIVDFEQEIPEHEIY